MKTHMNIIFVLRDEIRNIDLTGLDSFNDLVAHDARAHNAEVAFTAVLVIHAIHGTTLGILYENRCQCMRTDIGL
jgi:hypothetical protein